ncbi:MAG: hypothetical protein U0872_05795 [Planctomycetaceae bacterium]
MDERRRRRLAVHGEGFPPEAELKSGCEKTLPDSVPAEWCAASPWIPRAPWKLWTLVGLLYAGLCAIGFLVVRTPTFRVEFAPVLEPLFRSDQPRLVMYLNTLFWTLSGQLALLVGWHRAHSRLDFRGRYRVWPWAAALMFLCGLCAATGLHVSLGNVLNQHLRLEELLPRFGLPARDGAHLAWFTPACCLLLPGWWMLDRDIRRSLASIILLRMSLAILITGMAVTLYGDRFLETALIADVVTLCGLFGSATVAASLWVQGWYVAYVTPDPPMAVPFKLPKFFGNPFRWILGLILGLFRRAPQEAAPTRRRKKTEESSATKRKRKPAKRTSKPRKKVVEEELEEEDEEVAEDESADEEIEEDEESAESSEEEAEDEDEMPSGRQAAVNKPHFPVNASRQASNAKTGNGWASASQASDDEDDEDGEEEGEGPPAEMLKGLSKRQRRAVQKQWREEQRQRGR